MVELLKTPLWSWHAAKGAKMAEFGGWDMPIQYEGILAEHAAVRTAAGLFDTCHMGEFLLSGPGAGEKLALAVTNDVAALAPDRCRYGFLLNEDGGVLDDLIVYRLGADDFMLVVNAGTRDNDFQVLRQRLGDNLKFEDVSDATGKIDLQGPLAKDMLEALLGPDSGKIPYFSFRKTEYAGFPLTVSRTGYTGELGYELYCPAEKTLELWERLLADSRLKPAGLGARDTLRLEAGLPLYGHELDANHTPVESGFAAMITSKAAFVGRDGLERVRQRLLPMAIEGRRAARGGDEVYTADGKKAGVVASGSFAPSLGFSVLTAWVDDAVAGGNDFVIRTGRAELAARVTGLPFYKSGGARTKL